MYCGVRSKNPNYSHMILFDSPRWDVQRLVQTEEPRSRPPVWDRKPGRLHRRSAEQNRQDGLQDPQHKPTDEKTLNETKKPGLTLLRLSAAIGHPASFQANRFVCSVAWILFIQIVLSMSVYKWSFPNCFSLAQYFYFVKKILLKPGCSLVYFTGRLH